MDVESFIMKIVSLHFYQKVFVYLPLDHYVYIDGCHFSDWMSSMEFYWSDSDQL